MSTISAAQFTEICELVWKDRVAVLGGSGQLSGEATLVRAVFWRLCKAGIQVRTCAGNDASLPALVAYESVVTQMLKNSARPAFDSLPILSGLVERYQNEARKSS